jgi:antitoxin component YwqK of YwqJK toxin-antitoxin module
LDKNQKVVQNKISMRNHLQKSIKSKKLTNFNSLITFYRPRGENRAKSTAMDGKINTSYALKDSSRILRDKINPASINVRKN